MDRHATPLKAQLEALRLGFFRDHCDELAKQAAQSGLSHLEFLRRLVDGETSQRFEKLVARRVQQARMPFIKTLDQFSWEHARKINRPEVQALFSLDFIREKTNVVFLGPVGVGKTHLTLALANSACIAGYSVLFTTAAALVNNLTAARMAGHLPRELRRYTAPALLAVDELGFLPLDKLSADLLFQVISERYERGALVLTSNRVYKDWPVTFNNDSVFTSALLDRLLHHSQTIVIEGQSYRMRSKRSDDT